LLWMPIAGRTRCGYPISSRGLSAKDADITVPTCGQTSSGAISAWRSQDERKRQHRRPYFKNTNSATKMMGRVPTITISA
jgi:hypothetical protein